MVAEMKRRQASLVVSDHAVLRWLQVECGLDIERVRRHLTAGATDAAEYGAIALQAGKARMLLRDEGTIGEATRVVMVDVRGRARQQ